MMNEVLHYRCSVSGDFARTVLRYNNFLDRCYIVKKKSLLKLHPNSSSETENSQSSDLLSQNSTKKKNSLTNTGPPEVFSLK